MKQLFLFAMAAGLFYSCKHSGDTAPSGSGGWLKGNSQEKFETIASQLGGFDKTMMEVGYRYSELHYAGKNNNWEYAAYQAEEMEGAIEDGLERRPARAASSQDFMNLILPAMQQAIAAKDSLQFHETFQAMTASCISCHVMEEVAFIPVRLK
jgi:hypothetical protein